MAALFAGLVEETGTVREIAREAGAARLTITAEKIASQLSLGESVAVNGVCLTVATLAPPAFSADVMPETLAKTNLKELRPGAKVNLERALRLGDRIGGHFVTGHVDGTGRVLRLVPRGNAVEMWVEVPPELEKYLVPQGSVALDGVSLTVAALREGCLMVSLIPHTRLVTTLGAKRPGETVNIETDILGKYVVRFLESRKKGGITASFLAEYGFA